MIRVNDRHQIEWREGMTVTRLLEACRFTSPKIAVFVNGELVRRFWIKSFKKVNERWMIKDMEVEGIPPVHRTKVSIREVDVNAP